MKRIVLIIVFLAIFTPLEIGCRRQPSDACGLLSLTGFTPLLYAAEGQTLTSGEIFAAIKEYVVQNSPWPKEDLLIECKKPILDEKLPAGKVDIQIKTAPGVKFFGFTPVEVVILLENQPYKNFMVYLDIDLKIKAYMAKHWIKRYTPLTSDNLVVINTYRSKVPRDVLSVEEDLSGKVAKVALAKGRIITQSVVDTLPTIRKGDLVNVVLKTDNLTITAKAQALGDSKKGELVKLRLLNSKKDIYGRVVDEKTVVVEMEKVLSQNE